jgi:hypothetical protein
MMAANSDPAPERSTANPLDAIGRAGVIRATPLPQGPPRSMPRDGAVPHMAEALDVDTMRLVLQKTHFAERSPALAAAGAPTAWQVRRCEIEWIKYRPGKNCAAAYRVHVEQPSTGRRSVQLLCARVFEPGGSHPKYAAIHFDELVIPEAGRAVTHVPELDMIVWAFPNDSKLHALPAFVDEAHLRRELLPAVVASAWGPDQAVTAMTRDVIQYVPEEGCTVRVRARLEHARTGEAHEQVFYGRLAKGEDGAETYAMMQRLWNSEARKGGRLGMARPLMYDPDRRALWESGVPGKASLEEDIREPRARALLARAASLVAALHTTDVPCSRAVEVADARSRLLKVKQLAPQVSPSCRDDLDALVDRLLAESERLGEQPRALLHGDLRLRHLDDGDDMYLIDMEKVCLGSPWRDIGSFAAATLYKGMLAEVPTSVTHEALATFCSAYAGNVPWPMSRAVLSWYTAVALVNERAYRFVSRLQPDKVELVGDLVRLAQQVSTPEGIPWC